MKKLFSTVVAAILVTFGPSSWAAPTSGAYVTDTQNEYVQDQTAQGINNVNMVLCIMGAMGIKDSGMLNKGSYIALIDLNKCQSKGGSGGSSGNSSGSSTSSNYMTAIVDATRASNTAPMIAHVWMSLTEQGKSEDIYVRGAMTTAPTTSNPYGVFRLDYIGYASGTTSSPMMNGYIDASTTALQYYETSSMGGNGSSTVALTMTSGSTDSGSGTMSLSGFDGSNTTSTFDFNYNTGYFRRSDGTHDQCFDRAKANANKAVWRYGTYDASTGARVDLTNPGFPVTATYNGQSYYGYASYYGVNFQGLDLNAITGSNPISGLTVTDQRPNKTSVTYNLSRVAGKLTKWSKNSSTLSAMSGIPFSYWGDLTNKTSDTTNVTGSASWQMQWNNSTATFTVLGKQTCGSNGCALKSLTTPATVTAGTFSALAINGWSDSFGGNINIAPTGADHVSTDAVDYYSQSDVVPGTSALTLYCLSNCPDATSVTSANSYTSGTVPSPFSSTTANQWFMATTGNTVSYTFDSGGLKNGTTAMTITNKTYFSNNYQYSNGVMTGRLFDAALTNANCPTGVSSTYVCEPKAPTAYYTWQTGTNQWSQDVWLTKTSDSSVVSFDPPQNISYTVPATVVPSTSSWVGKTIFLQFSGFGNLWGIPGHCVNPVDNTDADCTSSKARYVPDFALPDGATMTMGTTSLILKGLDAEVRLKNLGAGAAACSSMALASQTLPAASGLHDMAKSTDSYYLGSKPTPSSLVPKVIDGVVQ